MSPEPIGNIYSTALRHRAALLREERAAAGEMVRAYGGVWERIREKLDALLLEREAALARGEEVTAAWLSSYERMTTLQRQVEAELWNFAGLAETNITAGQRWAVAAAEAHSAEQIGLGLDAVDDVDARDVRRVVSFNRLPSEAVLDLVGFTGDGSPLRTILSELAPQGAEGVRDALIQGVALGKNPRQIARDVRKAFATPLQRTLTVSRTEVLRTYREATRRNYQENGDVVEGWIWVCACTPRSCASCWAMHGTVHGLNERLDDHPNGRCVAAPKLSTLGGLFDEQQLPEPGADRFARLSEEDQRRVLGIGGAAAYRAGAVKLEDFVGRKRSRDWGTTRSAKSLGAILGPEEARKWLLKALEDNVR